MARGGADASERSLGIRRSPIYSRPVVAQLPVQQYVRTDATNPQEMRRADAADAALNKQRGYVQHVPTITSPTVVTAADTALGQQNAFRNAFAGSGSGGSGAAAGPNYGDLTDRMKLTESGRQFDITNASDNRQFDTTTAAAKAQNDIANALNQAQFDLQVATTAQGRADARAKYDALKNYYDSGEWKTGYDKLNTMLTDNFNTGVTSLQGTYDRSQQNLNAGYDLAKGLTDQGYSVLQNYLQQNPNYAFAGLQQQVQTVANPMEQFLGAYGVSNQPVQAQMVAEQLAGQQGAGAFNTLADILNRNSQQSDSSRMAEMQMAQTMANAGLGANRANYQARNAEAQAQALAQLQQQLAQNQFGVQQNQIAAGDAARQAILAATGDFGNGGTGNGGTGNGGTGNDGTNNDGVVYNDLVERNPPPYNPGVASGIDESTRVPEVTPDILEALRRSLAGLGAGFGQGFLTR
jgi:hypothetical protein